MFLLFLLVISSSGVTGCGTLSGYHEIVGVTTRDDPVLVKLDDEPNFFSPDFIRMHRGRDHQIELIDAKSKLSLAKGEVRCEPRWITSGLCNLALTIANPLIGAVGFGVDLWTGADFDCRGTLPLPPFTETAPRPRPKLCPTFLIAPPGNADFYVSQRLRALWQEAKRKEPGFCGRFIDPQTSERVFNYLNISNLNAATFPTLSRAQANVLGYEAKADHLVVLQGDLGQSEPRIDAEIIDLHTLKREAQPGVPIEKAQAKTLAQFERPRWLMYSISLVPNTIMYGGTSTARILTDTPTGKEVTSQREHGILPKAISSLAVGTLDHPMGFDEWDASLRFYPTIDFNLWSVKVDTPSHDGEVKYQAFFIHFPYNMELSLYTPVGAFGFAVGTGPMPTWAFRNRPVAELLWTNTAEVSWTAFSSRDIFVQAALDYNHSSKPIENNGVSCSQWIEGSFRLGYFTDIFNRAVQSAMSPQMNRFGTASN